MWILKKIFLDCITNKKQYCVLTVICTFLFIVSIIFSNKMHEVYSNNVITYFPKNIMYINEVVPEDTNYTVYPTVSLNNELIENGQKINGLVVDINKLQPIDDVSDSLLKAIKLKVEEDETLINYSVVNNYNNEIINQVRVPNRTYNISSILAGDYPTKPNQILIPETLGLYLVNSNNLNSYEQLVEENYIYNSQKYQISGVYSSNDVSNNEENIIIYAPKIPDNELNASFIEVKNSDIKGKIIQQNQEVLSSDNNAIDSSKLILVGTYVAILIFYIMLLRPSIESNKMILNHYNKSLLNNYLYAIAILLFNIIYLIVVIILSTLYS